MDELKWTVYMHINKVNNKVYIGITHEIKKRWRGGGCAYKNNPHFWQAIEKYGWDGFEHKVLFSELTKEEACNKEIQLITEYQATDRTKGYNNSSGGENPLVWQRGKKHPMYGKHHSEEARARMSASHTGEKHRCWGTHLPEITRKRIGDANRGRKLPEWQIEHLRKINTGRKATEETKQKMSRAHKGHPTSEETKQRIRETKESKSIIQFAKTGEFLCQYPSVTSAAKDSGLDRSQIRKCCRGELKTTGGFVWKYADEVDEADFLVVSEKKRSELIEEGLRARNTKQRRAVIQLTLDGEPVRIWESLTKAAEGNGMQIASICHCCKGIISTSGGYRWEYIDFAD